ncbi:NRDE family protein [Halobellus ordinarius]|uniref:NRDE family protein n=1 Tax=Halobellus ordinarius TaxID=3075120 RepID=UPI0028806DAD|nr:NRDE family protein [Halobellus sp. ZY16]
MCTLTLAWRAFDEAPVVVAANRDELLERDADLPTVEAGDPSFVAPRDAEAGGTWIGYNESGVFAGITNRWVEVAEGGERSRGLLVRDVLRAESAAAARATVEAAVETDTYDGFNLVVAERGDGSTDEAPAAYLFEWDGDLEIRRLEPGVHVVVNVGVDGEYVEPEREPSRGREQAQNAERVREALDPEAFESAAAWRDAAAEVLGDHDYGVCIHEPERGFGTRSSSLITLYVDGSTDFAFADGPPCETPFRRVESQL